MKVLHIYKTYYPETLGGIEAYIEALAKEGGKRGIEHHLWCTTKKKQAYVQTEGSVTVHATPQLFVLAACPVSFKMLLQVRALAKKFDVIHAHFPWPFADLLALLLPKDIPIIVTYHSDIVRQKWLNYFYTPLMHCFLRRVKAILPTSQNYVLSSPVLRKYQDKCHIVPIGVQDRASGAPDVNNLSQWRKKIGEGFLLFVGVLRYYKGLHLLLDAMVTLDMPLVIAGNGPEKEALMAQAKKLRLSNVTFLGYVSDADKDSLFRLAKAVVVPSQFRSEAFCITLAEGLMYGKPLISTELGTGTSFVNQQGVTGYVVKAASVSALTKAIEALFADEQQYHSFSKAARHRFERLFSAPQMAESIEEIYLNLIPPP
jgi:glycosyltransferase involved in cell wall biosynthesis